MFDWIFSLLNWVTSLWSSMPDAVKEKIISTIVETFDSIFRAYFHSEKTAGANNA
jgi:hypothetical protein